MIDKSKPVVPKKEEISDSARELGNFIEQMQRLRDATEEVSEQEKALVFLKANPGIDTPQVRELVLQQAELTDSLRAEADMRKELARIQKEQFAEEKRLTDQVLELAGVAEEERKIALTKQLEIMIAQGRISQEQALRAVKGIAGIKDEIKETDDLLGNLGSSMKSAFGDAVAGGERLGEVLKRLNDRIMSMVTDKLFEKAFGGLFGGRGGGGDLFSSIGSIFGGFGGGFGGGGGSAGGVPGIGAGDLPSMNLASVRPSGGVTIVNNIAQVGSNVSRADMLAAMEQTSTATIGRISELHARGRLKLA